MEYQELKDRVRTFVQERDWDQFHSPENLSKSISIEAAELLECFQWDGTNFNQNAVEEELSDVFIYCIQMADKLGIDLIDTAASKLEKNIAKYPIDKAKGNSKKYNEL